MPQDVQDSPLPYPPAHAEELHNVDIQLALNILEQIDLPPICVRWEIGYQFLLYHFQPSDLYRHRICTFRYIPGDARPLFRQCYIGILTLLDALPAFDQSPTACFLHQKVLAFLTALPALLVSQVTALGPNGVLDTIKKNCQQFLEGKWSHLYHAACTLHARAGSHNVPAPIVLQPPSDERFYRNVHQLVQAGSLSAAYQRLTQPGLCPHDPLSRFLEIHRDVDLSTLNLHPDSIQEVRDNTDWEDFFAPGDVFRLISRRKNGKAADRHGMRNEFLKVLQQDPAFLPLFIKGVLIGIAQGQDPFSASCVNSCTGAMLIAPLKPNGLPRPVQIPDMFRAVVTSLAAGKVFKSKEATNFLETGAQRTDSRYSQRGLSKDGCAYVVKEIQRKLEAANALAPPVLSMDEAADLLASAGSISPNTVVVLKAQV